MTTSRVPRSSLDGTPDGAAIARLEQENAQLRHAVDPGSSPSSVCHRGADGRHPRSLLTQFPLGHATVDQAIGVLTASHQLAPAVGSLHDRGGFSPAVCSTGQCTNVPSIGSDPQWVAEQRRRPLWAPEASADPVAHPNGGGGPRGVVQS
ncbi:hypothetical protein ACFTZF_15890 [Streptomyces mirabilis]|uniref:hypothetical protein n=1 Tax=Streptomyces mirabilis TaxID=68239 RepID=UPI003640C362